MPTLASHDGESEAGRSGSEAKPFFIQALPVPKIKIRNNQRDQFALIVLGMGKSARIQKKLLPELALWRFDDASGARFF